MTVDVSHSLTWSARALILLSGSVTWVVKDPRLLCCVPCFGRWRFQYRSPRHAVRPFFVIKLFLGMSGGCDNACRLFFNQKNAHIIYVLPDQLLHTIPRFRMCRVASYVVLFFDCGVPCSLLATISHRRRAYIPKRRAGRWNRRRRACRKHTKVQRAAGW